MTQEEMIMNHIEQYGGITTAEAFDLYGITRLASRVHDLRAGGYAIVGRKRTCLNRFGKPVTYMEYRKG